MERTEVCISYGGYKLGSHFVTSTHKARYDNQVVVVYTVTRTHLVLDVVMEVITLISLVTSFDIWVLTMKLFSITWDNDNNNNNNNNNNNICSWCINTRRYYLSCRRRNCVVFQIGIRHRWMALFVVNINTR